MKPVIGITPSPFVATTGAGELERYAIAACYVNGVIEAGGIPIVLPPQDGAVARILQMVDGLLFSGGADIDPALYGDDEVHPTTYDIHPLRDRFELDLIKGAIAQDIPTFCICRGIQVLNVALGGTLYQHVPDQFATEHNHRQGETGHRNHESSHDVIAEEGSLLASAYGQAEIPVNSYHHQAVKDVAPGLKATAVDPDGLVEAVEMPGKRFVLGVQWHPEMMFSSDGLHLGPFKQLVESAAARRLAGATA